MLRIALLLLNLGTNGDHAGRAAYVASTFAGHAAAAVRDRAGSEAYEAGRAGNAAWLASRAARGAL